MIKQLAIKELRESLGILTIAALGMAWAIAQLMGYALFGRWLQQVNFYPGQGGVAFVADSFSFYASLFVGGMAIGLGLKQSAWENAQGTYFYLLHRPISRGAIFGTKLVVGVMLVLMLLTVSILCYAAWAEAPGHQAAPFEWSMTLGAWKLMLTLPLVYLGAFLSGLRPGRWFGTRMVPLLGTLLMASLKAIPLWWLVLPLALIAYGLLLTTIAYYLRVRDY